MFWNDLDEGKSDEVDGSIGECSPFHEQFGYYGQGVAGVTDVLPDGWRDRVVPFIRADADPSTVAIVCPTPIEPEAQEQQKRRASTSGS